MHGKTAKAFVALLATVALVSVASVGMVGAVDNPEIPFSENVSVDNDTESIRVLAENIENETADVYFYEVNTTTDNRTETLANSGQLNTSGDGTDSLTFSNLDTANFSTYEVVVNGTESIASLTVEKLQVVSGGGGVLTNLTSSGKATAVGGGLLALLAGAVGYSLRSWD